jgi:hypothetical protein
MAATAKERHGPLLFWVNNQRSDHFDLSSTQRMLLRGILNRPS